MCVELSIDKSLKKLNKLQKSSKKTYTFFVKILLYLNKYFFKEKTLFLNPGRRFCSRHRASHTDSQLNIPGTPYRIRLKTEEKAKVLAALRGIELIQFLATLELFSTRTI